MNVYWIKGEEIHFTLTPLDRKWPWLSYYGYWYKNSDIEILEGREDYILKKLCLVTYDGAW